MAREQTPSDARPVRVAVVDDHQLVHQGLMSFIDDFEGYEVTMAALNGRDLVARYGDAEPVHIAIVDMYMPVMSGPETIQWLRTNWPDTRILALSFDRTPAILQEALRAGAHGFVPKDVSPMDLHDAFDSLMRRGSYFNDALLREHAAAGDAPPAKNLLSKLTDTELKVLDCACAPDEPTWEMVASRLVMSLPTVHTHRVALFRKLELRSKGGLLAYGRAHGFGKGRYWKQGVA